MNFQLILIEMFFLVFRPFFVNTQGLSAGASARRRRSPSAMLWARQPNQFNIHGTTTSSALALPEPSWWRTTFAEPKGHCGASLTIAPQQPQRVVLDILRVQSMLRVLKRPTHVRVCIYK